MDTLSPATVTLVHIGDFHAGPGPRNADRFRALDQLIDECLDLPRLGAWLWPGDLNHGRMTIDDRNAMANRLQFMAQRAPVLICYGNHDLPGDLEVFGKLQGSHPIIVVDRPMAVRLVLANGDVATVFVLPYPTKAGLTSMGVAKGDVVATAAEALDFVLMEGAANLNQARAEGRLTLAIGHVNVAGSMTSSGQPNIGHEIEIGRSHLDRLGDCYKGLNHIHVGQEIAGAWYAGSVCRLNWGEIEPKRYLLAHCTRWEELVLEADQVAGPDSWTYKVESKPLNVAPMYHVEGTLTRDGFTWVVKDGPNGRLQERPSSWKGCEVRVRYTFPKSERDVLLHAQVHAEFAEALRLEVEPVAAPDRQLRAPAVATARTLGEKVAAFAQVDTLLPSLSTKLAALEHGDAVTMLADLQRELDQVESGEAVTA